MFDLLVLLLNLARYFTGTFKDVVQDTSIPWDPDASDIQISTDEAERSGELYADFYDDSALAGGVEFHFTFPIKYKLYHCMGTSTPFPITPPTETEKIWRISYTQTSQQIEIFCNHVKVADLTLSDDVCDASGWRDKWEEDVKKITFYGTASDKYCTVNRGSYVVIKSH